MEPDTLAYLKEYQIIIGLKLLRHCQILSARIHGWAPHKTLPQGKDPECIVFEVIAKYLDGTRKINPDWPLETQLKKAIQRRLEWLKSEAGSNVSSLDELVIDDENAGGASSDDSPDIAAADRIDQGVLWRMMNDHSAVVGSENLQLMLMAIEEGASSASEQSASTTLPMNTVYELRDKLRAIYREILPIYHKGGIAQ
jgi:hypothetical protein